MMNAFSISNKDTRTTFIGIVHCSGVLLVTLKRFTVLIVNFEQSFTYWVKT